MWLNRSLKMATIVAYFLPVIFFIPGCDGAFNLNYSYNQKEADKNLAIQNKYYETNDTGEKVAGYSKDTVRKATTTTAFGSSSDEHQKNERSITGDEKWERFIRAILMPTQTSLSGIGAFFYFKNDSGKVLMAISILLAMLNLFPFKNRFYKMPVFILSGNIICITAFIINCILCDVTMLAGFWVLTMLLLVQLVVHIKTTNQSPSALTA